ncbi:hypothetical protein EDC96DRAFT_541439 [Choanephora cucurbitarum]|nr:hypothetical protein EDC96DRAFT_541439 [Choanephora cucurbitarum]
MVSNCSNTSKIAIREVIFTVSDNNTDIDIDAAINVDGVNQIDLLLEISIMKPYRNHNSRQTGMCMLRTLQAAILNSCCFLISSIYANVLTLASFGDNSVSDQHMYLQMLEKPQLPVVWYKLRMHTTPLVQTFLLPTGIYHPFGVNRSLLPHSFIFAPAAIHLTLVNDYHDRCTVCISDNLCVN